MLELVGLSGGWGATTVVEEVTLAIAPGETVGIIGRNGVGKSTLLELVMGRAQRRAGTVKLAGQDLSAAPTHRRARAGIGYVPQEREVFASLTVEEHLAVAARPGRWDRGALFRLFPSLEARRHSLGKQLSGGEQQMLAIARALIGNPSALLMDEPSEGLAPIVVEQLVDSMRAVVSDGALAILLVEQRVDIALDLATRCLIMDRGRLVHEAPSEALRRDTARLAPLMGLEA